jgi:hypothetical protein
MFSFDLKKFLWQKFKNSCILFNIQELLHYKYKHHENTLMHLTHQGLSNGTNSIVGRGREGEGAFFET